MNAEIANLLGRWETEFKMNRLDSEVEQPQAGNKIVEYKHSPSSFSLRGVFEHC